MAEIASRRLRTPTLRAALDGGVTGRGLLLGLTAGLVVGGLAFANGGYFPVSWGWSGLALLWLAVTALVLGIAVEAGALECMWLGVLAALTAWVALSLFWTSSVPQTVLELERTLVYVAAVGVGILLLRRSSVHTLLVGIWAAVVVVSTYAVATRLFPERLGVFDPISGYRLSYPVGYWNAFGILAAIGALLALGLAARSGPVVRCLAAGSMVVLLLTLYFTFSRGGWIAFFAGLVATIALDRRRLQLITVTLVLAPWPVLAIWAASTSAALTHAGAGADGGQPRRPRPGRDRRLTGLRCRACDSRLGLARSGRHRPARAPAPVCWHARLHPRRVADRRLRPLRLPPDARQEGVQRVQLDEPRPGGESQQTPVQPLRKRAHRAVPHCLAGGDRPSCARRRGGQLRRLLVPASAGPCRPCTTRTTSIWRRLPSWERPV